MRALCWGESQWGVRRLLTHIRNLPRDSAFARSVRGERAYWDETPELLAQLVDATERQTFYLLKVNGNDPKAPEPLRRPGDVAPAPKTVSLAEFASTLQGG